MSEKKSKEEKVLERQTKRRNEWLEKKDKNKTTKIDGSDVIGVSPSLEVNKLQGTYSQGKEFILLTQSNDINIEEATGIWASKIGTFRPSIVGMLNILYFIYVK